MSGGKNPRVTVSLSDTMKAWLDHKAELAGLSQSAYMRMLMAKAMESEKYLKEHLGKDMVKLVEALSDRPEVLTGLMDKPEK